MNLVDFGLKDAVDILLVALMLYYIYRLMRDSRSLNGFGGIMIFIVAWLFVSQILEMRLLGAILDKLSVMQLPLLVGVSRKSMIQKLLGCTADESLCGTIALNTFALMHGASILRVHDVRQAVECIRIVTSLTHQE